MADDRLVRAEVSFGFPTDVRILLASDSVEAMKLMGDLTPDVVIVDIRSGNAGGFSLSRDMSQTDRLRAVPILMLLERKQDEWLAQQAGATGWALKPIETSELVGQTLDLIAAPA